MTKVKDIYNYINTIAPYDEMEQWDNSGFILGDENRSVSRVVMALDATKSVAAFAKSVEADLLLTHHPIIFNPLKKILKGSAVYELINNDIEAMCAHTSFDKAKGGINDNLASLLNLKNTVTLENGYVVVGELEQEMSIDGFAVLVAETLDCHGLRYTDTDKMIRKVAVGGGACGDFMADAMRNSACFVTSDLKYHEMLDAAEENFAVINAGHFETENLPFLMLKEKLEKEFDEVEFMEAPVSNPILEI